MNDILQDMYDRLKSFLQQPSTLGPTISKTSGVYRDNRLFTPP